MDAPPAARTAAPRAPTVLGGGGTENDLGLTETSQSLWPRPELWCFSGRGLTPAKCMISDRLESHSSLQLTSP